MRFKLLFIFVFMGLVTANASTLQKIIKPPIDTVKKKSAVLIKDTSKVELRKFNADSIKKYSKQKEFIYDDVPPPQENWWDKFWRWFWEKINDLFSGRGYSPALKYFIIVLVIGVITFVVIKFFGVNLKMLTGKSKKILVPYEETLENIHEINFDDQIELALSNSNYRLVVRLLYLKTLKHLTDKELIFWQPEKTNQAYVLEITNEQTQLAFGKLTNQFEYIWYGEFNIDKDAFKGVNESFQHFNEQLK